MSKPYMLFIMALLSCMLCNAQKLSDSGYRTVGFIKPDGTVQDASYKTIGHAKDVPMAWASLYFFFKP